MYSRKLGLLWFDSYSSSNLTPSNEPETLTQYILLYPSTHAISNKYDNENELTIGEKYFYTLLRKDAVFKSTLKGWPRKQFDETFGFIDEVKSNFNRKLFVKALN